MYAHVHAHVALYNTGLHRISQNRSYFLCVAAVGVGGDVSGFSYSRARGGARALRQRLVQSCAPPPWG